MKPEALLQQLTSIFLEELEETLQQWESILTQLLHHPSKDPQDPLRNLFRIAHSLKGAAQAVQQPQIADFCHQLETHLTHLRDNNSRPPPPILQSLLHAGTTLQRAHHSIQHNLPLPPLTLTLHTTPSQDSTTQAPSQVPHTPVTSTPDTHPHKKPSPTPDPQTAHYKTPLEATAPPTPGTSLQTESTKVPHARLEQFFSQSLQLLQVSNRLHTLLGQSAELNEQLLTSPTNDQARHTLVQKHKALQQQLDQQCRLLHRTTKALHHDLQQTRTLPLREACRGLERLIQDLCRASDKHVQLDLQNQDLTLDRPIIDKLKPTFLQLTRNAIAHAFAQPEDATTQKPGTITLQASIQHNEAIITFADDGAGIDIDALKTSATQRGLPIPEDPNILTSLIFAPAISTSPQVDHLSGRGVGLDIVNEAIKAVHGTISVQSTPQQGTRFTIRVPLQLSTQHVLFFSCAGQTFAIPTTRIKHLLQIPSSSIQHLDGQNLFLHQQTPTPLFDLAQLLKLPQTRNHNPKTSVILLHHHPQPIAFRVDAFLHSQEAVIHDLGARLQQLKTTSGAILRPNGDIVLLLHTQTLTQQALWGTTSPPLAPQQGPSPHILVVDDSSTVRSLLLYTLQSAGYLVSTAEDGEAAWQTLQHNTPPVEAVISDIEMPQCDGLQLTTRIRQDPQHAHTPVILMSSLESPQDKQRGAQAGANAYFVKRAFSQSDLFAILQQFTDTPNPPTP